MNLDSKQKELFIVVCEKVCFIGGQIIWESIMNSQFFLTHTIYPLSTFHTLECHCSFNIIVNVKDESNHDFNTPHNALDDYININNWRDVEKSALAPDAHVDLDIDNSDRRNAVQAKKNGTVESEKYVKIRMIILPL